MNDAGTRRAYIDVGGRQVHYRHCGEREMPVLLLLHQTPSSSAMYLPLMDKLSGMMSLRWRQQQESVRDLDKPMLL